MKTASQRTAATREDQVHSAPQESPASRADARQVPRWGASGPAPAGTLHRLHAVDGPDENTKRRLPDLDDDYIPRRGAQRFSLRALGRTRAGRLTMGIGLAAVLVGVGVAGFSVRRSLLHDRRFLIATSADIDVTGNHHLTRADVLRIFSPDVQHNIFNLPLAARRSELERLPWVEHATIIRLLPNHLRIDLHERTPIAFVRQGTQIGLVDATGVLLDMPALDAGDPHYSFPVLTGLTPPALPEDAPLSTRAARLQIYTDFLHQLDSTGHKLSATISEVDVTDPEDLKALVAGDDQSGSDILVHFGDQDFLHRYQQFEQHLPTWRQQYPKLASADMRYDAQVVLEMQPGATTTPSPDPALTAAATPPPTSKPATGVTVPARPVIISHNTTTPAPLVAEVPNKPGAPSVPLHGTAGSAASTASTKPQPGAPRLASETWASSPAPRPGAATPKPGAPSVPLHATGGLAAMNASTKPQILHTSTPKPGAPSVPLHGTGGLSASTASTKPQPGAPRLASETWASSTAPRPGAATPKPGAPSVPLHGTGGLTAMTASTKPQPGAPRLASETWASSPAPRPGAATTKPGAPSVPLHGTGGLAAMNASTKPQILHTSTPKPAAHSSSANEKLFAQLAADHKAALAKTAKSKPAKKPTGAAQ